MTTATAKTIQIYLPTGEPRCIGISEITTRIVKAVLIPRSDLLQGKLRIDSHNKTKTFWKTAIICVSKTQNFTQAHIRYLEWYCIQRAKKVGSTSEQQSK